MALLAACSPRHAAEQIALGGPVVRRADLAYDGGPRQRLDVYRDTSARAPSPVVVFLYGGRWKAGSKRDYVVLAASLARRGMVVVVPDYRLHPPALFPAWVEDAASAVRWARDNAARYGGDSTRLFVVGHSAGAHTAAMLALDPHYLRDVGVPAAAVRGVVSLAGPVDTTWTDPDVQRLMGPRDGWSRSYPVTFVDGPHPPLLLLHGRSDDVVGTGNSMRLAARIRARGGCSGVRLYRRTGHIGIAVALAVPALRLAPVRRDVEAFVHDPDGFACPPGSRPSR